MSRAILIVSAVIVSLSISIAKSQQTYPNVPGLTLLDDDRVVVQKFVLQPGQWEGIHTHPEHQLVIVLNRTEEVTYRMGDEDTIFKTDTEELDDISVFWRRGPVTLEQRHESGNTGTRPLEWIAITFKDNQLLASENESASCASP